MKPEPIQSRPFSFRMEKNEIETVCHLVGTNGLERIMAISRLLEPGHTYREQPYLLTCHLLDLGIEKAEFALREGIGIKENPENRATTK